MQTARVRVQSFRGVGCLGGYPYYAWGVYEARPRKSDGALTWRLVKSGRWVRSDVRGRNRFGDVPVVNGVRHGTPVRSEHLTSQAVAV
jgi:hypothetical protein